MTLKNHENKLNVFEFHILIFKSSPTLNEKIKIKISYLHIVLCVRPLKFVIFKSLVRKTE